MDELDAGLLVSLSTAVVICHYAAYQECDSMRCSEKKKKKKKLNFMKTELVLILGEIACHIRSDLCESKYSRPLPVSAAQRWKDPHRA